jgi:RNA polymerase sigma-70 factor, ECF subfamily
MHSPDEKELLKRIRTDPQAFSMVYDQHYNAIFAYAFRRLGNYETARDIAAETFLKAFQHIGRFQWRSIPLSAWLFRIASNEINNYLRKAKYKPTYLEEAAIRFYLSYEEGIETEKASLEKAFHENEEFVTVQQQLLQLDIKYQEVIALRFFEDKSIKETATILGKNEGTVKSLLSRGLDKLKHAVEKKLNQG